MRGRKLLLEGGTQMLICQIVVATCFGAKFGLNGNADNLPKWYAIVVVIFICTYVEEFAWSWGPLGWLVPSEIFPLEIRSAAQSVNVSVNMMFTFIVAHVFLTMLCHLKFSLFLFFTFFVFVMFFVYFLPETREILIEEMSRVLKQHWYWKRFVTDEDYPNDGYEMSKNQQLSKLCNWKICIIPIYLFSFDSSKYY